MTGFDPASFRDPSGRLFRHAGALYRTCSPQALASFARARESGLLSALESAGCAGPDNAGRERCRGTLIL